MCQLWALHVFIKRQFFTFIFVVFLLNVKDIQYHTKPVPAAWNKRPPYWNNSSSLLSLTFHSSLESQFASPRGRNCVTVSNFVEIGQTAAEKWSFFAFSRWRSSTILDLLRDWLNHPRMAFGGLYHCANFGCNLCSSFDNMQVLVFYDVGLKTLIHAPLGEGYLGHISPKMSLIVLTPKRTVLGRNHVIWTIKREYRPRGSSWAFEWEVKDRTFPRRKIIFKSFIAAWTVVPW